ncbi:MAG: hypothetical protein FJW69_00865 [Actinobacteria bacterium]|nr:hypothetical protein [Actinomycetota bacterium]MBM3713509.1 hypothetical protein [Actinomycetota bacterium]
MEKKEIINSLNSRLKEIKNLRNLTAREPRFKNWHVSTIALLKNLSGTYFKDIGRFKKLSFSDTKYHRGKNIYNPADTDRYNLDLAAAENILKRIILQSQKDIQTENKKID